MPGEYIITFPGALHSGMNFGRNRAESVNFALASTFSTMYDQFTYGTECRYVRKAYDFSCKKYVC